MTKKKNHKSTGGFAKGNQYRYTKGHKKSNPKKSAKTRKLSKLIEKALEEEHNGRTIGEILVEQMLKQAMKGNFPFLREILDRTEGKVADRIANENGEGLKIIFKKANENDDA